MFNCCKVLMLSWSWSSRSNSGGYLRDYSPQWTPFFSPFPVVTQSAGSTGAVARSITLSLHVTNDVIVYFYRTYSSSAASAYVIPIFTTPRRHIKRYKKGNTGLILSLIRRTAAAATRRLPTYLLTSDDMDELRNLERIDRLCRILRQRREQQSITATG